MTPREQLLLAFVAFAIVLGSLSLVLHDRWAAAHPPAPGATIQGKPEAARKPAAPAKPADKPLGAAQGDGRDGQHGQGGEPEKVKADRPDRPAPAETRATTATPPPPRTIAVAVMGAVLRPRVYRVAEGARVRDLIERAGGLAPEADIADVNLAARLIDGTTLTIGARRVAGQRVIGEDTGLNPSAYLHSGHGVDYAPAPLPAAAGTDTPDAEIGGGAGIAKKPKAPSGPVNLNTADAEALATLPGIGPALASRIVAYRTQQAFSSVEDLAQVPGIGPKKLDAVRAYATVE